MVSRNASTACAQEYRADALGNLKTEDILEATGGEVLCGELLAFTGISIDSRRIQEGELFIPLRGERYDAHDFLDGALKTGSGALVQKVPFECPGGRTVISVPDTLKALQDIARYQRCKRGIPVIGITGSNGKTTTKELAAAILSTQFTVLKNSGNLNNLIGLPLSLAGVSEKDEVAVLEMGASIPGDIRELCSIALPDCGVLTNIGPSHLEGFGDIRTLRKTKLEILGFVRTAVVNADDRFLMEGVESSGFHGRLITYGIENDPGICARDIRLHEQGASFDLYINNAFKITVHTMLSGRFNIYNILAAISVGHLFNIEAMNIKQAVDEFHGVPMRLEMKERNGIRFIYDVYNANPASMEQGIQELVRRKKTGRAIAVLGDMLELGRYAEDAHRDLGRRISDLPVDVLISVGPLMSVTADAFLRESIRAADSVEAGKILLQLCRAGDIVLIKGSRGMRMERVLES